MNEPRVTISARDAEPIVRALRELAAAATEVVNAGFVCSPDLWKRLADATGAAGALLGESSTPTHEELLARGAESLGDGVYAQDTGGMIRLTGNAFGRDNVIFLESSTYARLLAWAKAHGYAPRETR